MDGNSENSQRSMHHKRTMDLLTLNQATLDNTERVVEGGGLRSTWSPDHEFESDIPGLGNSFAAAISKRWTSMTSSVTSISEMAQQPEFWNKFRPKERKNVSWRESFKAVATYSWLNLLLVFIPVAWGLALSHKVSHVIQFAFCFLAIIPLCKLLEFGGENLALYCGKDFGDLIIITLSNAVEAILALALLSKCELKLLQSTVIGVVLLRLLLIPGIAFISGGMRVEAQELHPHVIQLNQSLLFTSVLFLLLPVSFFAALDRGDNVTSMGGNNVVSDAMRGELLKVSRGMSVLLILVYIGSRFFLHKPIGQEHSLHERKDAPEELKKMVAMMSEEDPKMNIWVSILTLIVSVGLTAATAEFLVESIDPMKERFEIQDEWFGLILLPIVSFSGDGLVTISFFFRRLIKKTSHAAPPMLANYRPIEGSIQFILFWTPMIVLLAWCCNRPMSLLFDFYEMAILLGACFLVNFVTADFKTNWAEGMMLVALYLMITLTTWFYPGQPEIAAMLQCDTVSYYVANTQPEFFHLPDGSLRTARPRALPVEASISDAALSEKLQALLILYDILDVDDS